MMTPPNFFSSYREDVDLFLAEKIQVLSNISSRLYEAIRYSTLMGGKRIRPVLLLATADCFGIQKHHALPAAAALEMIHAYSLIHDDLPAMDDDDLRRGQPTCHKAYDEATAILAGDALQAMAFETLAQASYPAQHQVKMIETLAKASGSRGMVLGQAIDLESVGKMKTLEDLENMHRLKTGALIEASVILGAYCAPDIPETNTLSALQDYAKAIGLAFQVQDDILDVTSDTKTLGKQQGADAALNKPTYPALLGLDGARKKLNELQAMAHDKLTETNLPNTQQLREICDYIVGRVQ